MPVFLQMILRLVAGLGGSALAGRAVGKAAPAIGRMVGPRIAGLAGKKAIPEFAIGGRKFFPGGALPLGTLGTGAASLGGFLGGDLAAGTLLGGDDGRDIGGVEQAMGQPPIARIRQQQTMGRLQQEAELSQLLESLGIDLNELERRSGAII